MSVDWSEFRDGDRVRVVVEGTIEFIDGWRYLHVGAGNNHRWFFIGPVGDGCESTPDFAASAELIARPFTPPAAGKLFHPGIPTEKDCLYVSLGADGFRMVRDVYGKPRAEQPDYQWDHETQAWRDSIEVIDSV